MHVEKANLPGNALPETGTPDQTKLAPQLRNIGSGKSERFSEPERQNLESGHESAEIATSLESPTTDSSDPTEQAFANSEDVLAVGLAARSA